MLTPMQEHAAKLHRYYVRGILEWDECISSLARRLTNGKDDTNPVVIEKAHELLNGVIHTNSGWKPRPILARY